MADVRLSARKGSVRVRGKGRSGSKDRTVPLHAQARTTLAELLDELDHPAAGPLIRNRDGHALSTRAANTVVTALGAAAGIGEAFGPHVLRHTFGTDLLRGRGEVATAPVDVVLVAELMGHADLNTTRRYTLPSEVDKARALEALTTDR
ncbi:tyrosine-type recombinase/integrase [Nocardiopsis dassonvillei]|uniref:tyrosine-type recombinase/integrase n=1 Tax=Nocardiopsis dassonvillei TaxID=2014 RepID=UPI00366F451D